MTVKAFMADYNNKAKKLGHKVLIKEIKEEGNISALATIDPQTTILYGKDKDENVLVQVICGKASSSIFSLLAYSTVIDLLIGCAQEERNSYLDKLGLFNRELEKKKKTRTRAGAFEMKVVVNNPQRGNTSFFIKKANYKKKGSK